MLKNDFFKAFADDTKPPLTAPAGELPASNKETYTRAEVDELITRKIAETLESLKPETPAAPDHPETPEPPASPES